MNCSGSGLHGFKLRTPKTIKRLNVTRYNNSISARDEADTIFFLPGHSKDKFGKEPPQDALIMYNLETLLETTVDKARGNSSGAIVERFIKNIASKYLATQNIHWMGQGCQFKFQ